MRILVYDAYFNIHLSVHTKVIQNDGQFVNKRNT